MISSERASASRSRATIVVAEDDLATRMVLNQVLSREHFRVVAVENGKLACEAVRRERPDVVLLDWLMPVMDGREALAELKAGEETRGIPIVMLTSHSQVDERISALEAGVQDFLSKPFDPRELVACIEQQMRWRERLAGDADVAFVAERDALQAASERRHRLLAEAMPHIVWIAAPRGDVRYFNRAWYEFTGASAPAVRGGWSVAIHPDDRAPALRAWARSLATGRPYEMQHRLRRASDGVYRWHLTRAIPTTDDRGTVIEWVGSCSDIHDYKIASETRAILDTMGSIVAIRADDGFIDYASPYWSQYTGSSTGSAIGFGWRDFIHPDDLAGVERLRGEPDDGATTRQYEMRIRRHDGEYRWFLSQSMLLPRASGATRRWLDTSTDVDDLKRAQSALAASETRYRALADSMPQMVWVIGADAIEYVNNRWSEYTGLNLAATRASKTVDFVHPDDVAAVDAIRTAPSDAEYTCEARFRRNDGVFRWHAVRGVPFSDAAGDEPKWIGTATDMEESKTAAALLATAAAELEHLAHHDPMTNLPNRTLLVERLTEAIAQAQRAKAEVIVMYVDLDRFKIINDTKGHAAGDRVLAVTATRIADALRAGDTASRVGGDEFVLVCATAEAAEDAARLATRLIDAIAEPIDIDGDAVAVGASIGISMYPADGRSGEDLIRKADSAMYAAKQSGRNGFKIYHAETHSSIVAALDFEQELKNAIALGQIVVHFQPILSLGSDAAIGAEALVRWQHPQRGLLHPGEFLAFAEAHRLSGAIGKIVLDAVCAQIAALQASLTPGFTIAINVSGHQLGKPGWVAEVAAALAAAGADPARLQIEIAEKVVLSESVAVRDVLAELRELGVALSIDDFGTGHGSLASIKDLPLTSLKIDRSFIRGIVTNISDQAVAKTIVMLAHSLGLNAIATGVENDAQVAELRAYGADAYQGYLAVKPLPAARLADYLSANAT